MATAKIPRRFRSLSLGLGLLLGLAASASGLTMSGQVTDLAGTPIPHVRVEARDDNGSASQLLATVYTDDQGNYSTVVPSQARWATDRPDLFITVDWRFELLPRSFYTAHMVLAGTQTAAGGAPAPFTAKSSTVATDHDPATDLAGHNLAMDQTPAGSPGLLRQYVNEGLEFYRSNMGSLPWTFNRDLNATLRTYTNGSAAADALFIAVVDISPNAPSTVGPGFVSDIYHEVGHVVHWRFNNNWFPPHTVVQHTHNTESSLAAALIEGWPSYVAHKTALLHGRDRKYSAHEDAQQTNWRGDETPPTGRDNTAWESGEVVEGALGGVWFELDGLNGFQPNFAAMFNNRITDIAHFLQTYATQARAAGGNGAVQAYAAAYNHGFPYDRARFGPDPFPTDDPPDQATPEDGNVKEIGGKLFLRGKVKAAVEAVTAADLGVGNTLNLTQAGLAFKPAAAGTGEAATVFTSFLGFAPFASPHEVDTTTLGGTRGDGEWDLLMVGENPDNLRDTLRPAWLGDGNAAVNSDEKYLKTLGAWYDKDRNPLTEDDGKVVVDNTAPKVEGFKPQ